MPKKTETKPMPDAARYALIGTIITAALGLVSAAVSAYIQHVMPAVLDAHETQTAAAQMTLVQLSATPLPPTGTPTFTFVPIAATPTPPSPTNTPTPTLTLALTLTPTPEPPTLTPTFTLTPTATITPLLSGLPFCVGPETVVGKPGLNVRTGPGVNYNVIGQLAPNTCVFFDGIVVLDGQYPWLQVSPDQAGYEKYWNGWVYGLLLRGQDFYQLPVLPMPPLPNYTPTPLG